MEKHDPRIDAAARHLRETLQAGKRLTPWDQTPKATKKKWIVLATGTLEAADAAAWRPIVEAPKNKSILLLGFGLDEKCNRLPAKREIRRVGFFHEFTGTWRTADIERFEPRLWAELPEPASRLAP